MTIKDDASRPDGRTHYEATLDVRYGARYNELCERFYNRVDMLIGAAALMGGTAAAVSYFNKAPEWAAAAGAALAALAIFERLLSASRKAEQHCFAKREFSALDARAASLSTKQIDAELKVLQGSAPSGIELLSLPAYNDNLRTAGRLEHLRPMGPLQRVAAFIA